MAGLFDFEWYLDQHGYEAVSAEKLPEGMERPILENPPKTGWVLRRKGGPLRRYRPLEEHPGLFRRFAYLPEEPQAILDFANEFGILGVGLTEPPEDPDWEELSLWWLTHIRGLRFAVEAIDTGDAALMASTFNDYVGPKTAAMTARIEAVHGKRSRLQVTPTTLLSAMWFQVAGELTDGIRFKKCKWCPAWFPYGPRTGHRETKVFCSDRCRKAWNRDKEKEGRR